VLACDIKINDTLSNTQILSQNNVTETTFVIEIENKLNRQGFVRLQKLTDRIAGTIEMVGFSAIYFQRRFDGRPKAYTCQEH